MDASIRRSPMTWRARRWHSPISIPYVHQNEVQYSAVFVGAGAGREQAWRHGMDAHAYDREFDTLIGKGFGLKLVTGAGAASGQIFAAVWER